MKLTNNDLVSVIQAHRRDSLGVEDGDLTNERAVALDRYHGRPYGNEMEGRSAVVSRDLAEAVDWAMPAIMRIFTQSGSVAEFDPVSPEDEELAEIDTEYVNQVVMKDNPGWLVMHDAIKDTLLLKNGYVKHWWDESEAAETEEYEGLAVEEIQQLLTELAQDGADVKILAQEEGEPIITPMGAVPVFDIKISVTRKKGRVLLEAVPCEEIRVSKKCRGSLQESPFVEHVTLKTRSDLIEMGMAREWVDELPAYESKDTGGQSVARDSVSEESSASGGGSYNDRAMDLIQYCEAYIRCDWNDDGIAELRRVVTVADKIPDGDEWNVEIPECAITGFVAKRIPHRHVGESIHDELGDLAEIKTVLLRQMLDNVYLTNNNQWLVNERVNLNDFMVSLPGGIKRIQGIDPVAGSAEPIITPSIVNQILPVVDYIDTIKEGRTGINRATTGLDPDVLKQTTKGAFLENLNRASQKIEMITRLIAETGVKEMVLRVHSLLRRYQDKARVVRMKGKYVPVNPSQWKERTDVTVKVGLGTGNEEDRQRKLMLVAELQAKMLAPAGLVDAPQAFALFSDLSKTMGFDMPEKYAMSPDSPEYQQKKQQPGPVDPHIQVKQMELQADAQKFQAMTITEREKADRESQLDIQKFQAQAAIDQQKADRVWQQEQLRSANDVAIEKEKIAAQMELERYKAELKAQTDLQIAQLQLQAQAQQAALDAQAKANDQQMAMAMHQEKIAAMTKPKKLVRDDSGRASGLE